MRFSGLIVGMVVLLAACAPAPGVRGAPPAAGTRGAGAGSGTSAPDPTMSRRGYALPPGRGERFIYCARPLALTLKVDSETVPGAMLVAGIGELHGDEGIGRHRTDDEVLYVIRGRGHAVFGTDTVPIGPGSMAYVPPGVPHRIVSTEPLHYFFVLSPDASGEGFRRAARIACPASAASSEAAGQARSTLPPGATAPTANSGVPSTTVQPTAAPGLSPIDAAPRRALAIPSADGDRVSYCRFPLVVTTKVDAESAPGSRLTAAVGSLRRGSEVGTHDEMDEVAYITHGRGRAFIGADTVPVQAGSFTYVPRGTVHGFINDGDDTLEYVVVYAGGFSRKGFRALATRPGRYCPESVR